MMEKRSCIVARHTVSGIEELASFLAGYIIGATETPPVFSDKKKGINPSENCFREFLAGFYVGIKA